MPIPQEISGENLPDPLDSISSEKLPMTKDSSERSRTNVMMESEGRIEMTPHLPEVAVESEKQSTAERILERIRSWTSRTSAKKSQGGVSANDDAIVYDADAIMRMDDAEGRVGKLLDLAMEKGPVHAVSVARRIDAYTLDRTHDCLADDLSERLREQGLLPETET